MKRYLCPVCDQELNARSYCPVCRRIVRKPVIYEGILPNEDSGEYLLNHDKLHPGTPCVEPNRERTCQSRQEIRANARFTGSGAAGTQNRNYQRNQSSAPGSNIWRSAASTGSTWKSTTSGNTVDLKKNKKTRGCGLFVWIAIFYLIFNMAVYALSNKDIVSWFEEKFSSREETRTPENSASAGTISETEMEETAAKPETEGSAAAEPGTEEESTDYDDELWEEADYDHILALGEQCSGYWHYHVQGQDIYEELAEYVTEEMGLVMTEQSDLMSNDIKHDPYYGDITFYDHYLYWDWEDGYFGVICDSVTGETHYVSVYGWNGGEAVDAAVRAALLLEDEWTAELVRDELNDAIDRDDLEEGYSFYAGGSSVWIGQHEKGYYMIELSATAE